MKRLFLTYILTLLLLSLPVGVEATDYYVDTASDGGDGTTTATTGAQAAFKTVAAAQAAVTGDQSDNSLLFNKGNTWNEQFTVGAVGTSGHLFTIGAYGTGAAPIINAAETFDGGVWTADGGSYKTAMATECHIVIYDGTVLEENDGAGNTVGASEWDWSANECFVNVGEDPDVGVAEAGQRDYGIDINNLDYVTVDGITVTGANVDGLIVRVGSTNITAQNCTGYRNWEAGFAAKGTGTKSEDITFDTCTAYENVFVGINVYNEVDNATITKCIVHDNAPFALPVLASGIYVESSDLSNNLEVSYCKVYNTVHGVGIYIDEQGSGVVVKYNQSWDNSGAGICVESTDGAVVHGNLCWGNDIGVQVFRASCNTKVYNNSCYGNSKGIEVNHGADVGANAVDDNLIKNNISSGNTSRELVTSSGGANDGTYGSGNVYEYNCFGAEAAAFMFWSSGTISTYDVLEDAGHYNANTYSVEAASLMTDPANDDFTLKNKSPCRCGGANLGASYDDALEPGTSGTTARTVLQRDNCWTIGAYGFNPSTTCCDYLSCSMHGVTMSGGIFQ